MKRYEEMVECNREIHWRDLKNPHVLSMLFLIFDEQERDILSREEADEINALLEVENCCVLFVGKTDRCLKCLYGADDLYEISSVDLDQTKTREQVGRKDEHWLRNLCGGLFGVVVGLALIALSSMLLERYFIVDKHVGIFGPSVWWQSALMYLPNLLGCFTLTDVVFSAVWWFEDRSSLPQFMKKHQMQILALWTASVGCLLPESFIGWTRFVLSAQYGTWYAENWQIQCAFLQNVVLMLAVFLLILWLCQKELPSSLMSYSLTMISWLTLGLSMIFTIWRVREVLLAPIILVIALLMFIVLTNTFKKGEVVR